MNVVPMHAENFDEAPEIFRLEPDGVAQRADEMRPLIERLASKFPHGSFTFHGVLKKYYTGEWTCWITQNDDGSIRTVAASAMYPDMKGRPVFEFIFIAGGDKAEVLKHLETFERVLSKAGVKRIEFLGRHGWHKDMSKAGYRSDSRLYSKELSDG